MTIQHRLCQIFATPILLGIIATGSMPETLHFKYEMTQLSPVHKSLGTLQLDIDPDKAVLYTILGDRPFPYDSLKPGTAPVNVTLLRLGPKYGIILRANASSLASTGQYDDAEIDGIGERLPSDRIPYIPGNWMPFPTASNANGKNFAMISAGWQLVQVRIEGPHDTPNRMLDGVFPNLPDSEALDSYVYNEWNQVGGYWIPSLIIYTVKGSPSRSMQWVLTSSSTGTALAKDMSVHCGSVSDSRLMGTSKSAGAQLTFSAQDQPVNLTQIAERNSAALAELGPITRYKGPGRTPVYVAIALGAIAGGIIVFTKNRAGLARTQNLQ